MYIFCCYGVLGVSFVFLFATKLRLYESVLVFIRFPLPFIKAAWLLFPCWGSNLLCALKVRAFTITSLPSISRPFIMSIAFWTLRGFSNSTKPNPLDFDGSCGKYTTFALLTRPIRSRSNAFPSEVEFVLKFNCPTNTVHSFLIL